jgi:phospholipid-binding lipoprotein MlaA
VVVLWLAAGLLAGCASTATTRPANPADPWEKTNRAVDRFNDKLDRYALKPASDFYVKITTPKLRQSVHNAFTNLGEIDTIVNDLLEPKPRQAGSDSLRLVVNSTLGIGGLFDMATPMGLKHHDEDFGLTLGHWGAGQGRYVVLPFLGPSTVRDAPGIAVGILDDPLTWISAPAIIYPIDALQVIDFRTSADNIFLFRNAAALDPYVFTRQAYLAHRQFLLEGPVAQTQPAEQINYFEDEPATQPAPPTQPATGPAASQP